MAPSTKKADGASTAKKVAAVLKRKPLVTRRKIRTTVHFYRPKTVQKKKNRQVPRRSIPRRPRMDEFRVIKTALTTETAMKKIEENNTLVFLCDTRANKYQIRDAVRKLYSINPEKVNTLIRPDGQKKAFVKLSRDVDAVDVANRLGLL